VDVTALRASSEAQDWGVNDEVSGKRQKRREGDFNGAFSFLLGVFGLVLAECRIISRRHKGAIFSVRDRLQSDASRRLEGPALGRQAQWRGR